MVIEYSETVTSISGADGNILTIGSPSSDMALNSYKGMHFIYENDGDEVIYEILSNTTTTITLRLPLDSDEGIPDLSDIELNILRYYAQLKHLRARTHRVTDFKIVVDDLDVDEFLDEITGDINEELELDDGSDTIDTKYCKSLRKIILDIVMSLIVATRQIKERDVDNVFNVYYNREAKFSKLHLRKLSRIKRRMRQESRGSKSSSVYSNDQGNKIY